MLSHSFKVDSKAILPFSLTRKKLSQRNPEELAQGEFEKYFLI